MTGDIYFGEKGRKNNGDTAYDIAEYSRFEVELIALSFHLRLSVSQIMVSARRLYTNWLLLKVCIKKLLPV